MTSAIWRPSAPVLPAAVGNDCGVASAGIAITERSLPSLPVIVSLGGVATGRFDVGTS